MAREHTDRNVLVVRLVQLFDEIPDWVLVADLAAAQLDGEDGELDVGL
jgi:hypothetical protein